MKQKEASVVWNLLQGMNYNATARRIDRGPLAGKHVVEIEPGPALVNGDIAKIMELAQSRSLELTYGEVSRRVLVLS